MRRLAVLIAAVLVAAVASPASAAVTTQVVHGLPPSMYALGQDCLYTTATDPLLRPVSGPATAPLGTGSLAVPAPAGHETAIWTETALDLSSLGTWKGATYVGTAGVIARVTTDSYVLAATVPTVADSWTGTDFAGLTYDVYSLSTGQLVATQTIAQFLAAHPSETSAYLGFVASNCDGTATATVYLDDYTITAGGNGTTYDFEPGLPISLSPSAPAKIVAGHVAVVHVRMTSNGTAVRNRSVRLIAVTGDGYQLVGSYPSDSTGTVSAAVRPLVTTSYYWRFDGDAKYDPQQSARRTVQVATRLTISTPRTTLKAGGTLVVSGKVFPHHAGATVTLWRRTSSGRARLGTAPVGSAGTFLFAKVLRSKGTYRVLATIPAMAGDAAGASPTVTVTVR